MTQTQNGGPQSTAQVFLTCLKLVDLKGCVGVLMLTLLANSPNQQQHETWAQLGNFLDFKMSWS